MDEIHEIDQINETELMRLAEISIFKRLFEMFNGTEIQRQLYFIKYLTVLSSTEIALVAFFTMNANGISSAVDKEILQILQSSGRTSITDSAVIDN